MSNAVPILDTFARKNPSCIWAIIGSRTAQKLCIITVTGTRNTISSQAPTRARYPRMTLAPPASAIRPAKGTKIWESGTPCCAAHATPCGVKSSGANTTNTAANAARPSGARYRVQPPAPARPAGAPGAWGMSTSVFIPPSRPFPQKLRETIPALSHPRFHSRRHHAVEILHIGVRGDARDLRLAVETFERRRLGQFMVAGDAFENQGGRHEVGGIDSLVDPVESVHLAAGVATDESPDPADAHVVLVHGRGVAAGSPPLRNRARIDKRLKHGLARHVEGALHHHFQLIPLDRKHRSRLLSLLMRRQAADFHHRPNFDGPEACAWNPSGDVDRLVEIPGVEEEVAAQLFPRLRERTVGHEPFAFA